MNKKDVFILFAIVGLRAILSIFLWNHTGGFFLLTGDDASRTALAYYWSQDPFFNLPGNPAWLPLGIWLHGIVLKFVDDPLLVSSLVNSIFSIASDFLIYKITQRLFPGKPVAPLFAAVILAFCPLLIWLGLSGLSEAIFHFWMLIGLLFWLLASATNTRMYLLSSIGFLGASMIRFEAWILVIVFAASCAIDLKRSQRKGIILMSVAVAGAFIPIWLYWQWKVYGHPLHFIQIFTSTSPKSGLTQYVLLLWNISRLGMILAFLGVVVSLWKNECAKRYLLFTLVFYFTFMFSMRGFITSNFPVRNLTSVFLLLIPFAGYGIEFIVMKLGLSRMGVYMVMMAWMIGGSVQSFGHSFQARDELVKTAIWSRRIIRSGLLRDGSKILLEARHGGPNERDVVWDSLFLHAVNPAKIHYDKIPDWRYNDGEWVIREWDNPSILDGQSVEVEKRLRSQKIQVVIAYSKPVLKVIESIMKPIAEWKEYRIYIWPDDDEFIRKLPSLHTGKSTY